ncbi:MAG: zinc ABC transporter substrate-binding protein [Proteobacteria bacterium]|nr:zinc ABC transporter substrate-binding protein [Pseudomonadota bacterium]MBU1583159.1 zinc ABC transporter substrate-binding protein [Pseudomonadota bacterium]MBU2431924.1 zinc ABC transporter substrate-binding protein [Pseudomonadota bacterium]MBU2452936.1 zinc ABC transporter substrate-binding protein [Pseudomonadota bacterium]MBU2627526.1 zinc ABC transporter substrate-binding protein [Pseudomonadota bacterium]
MKNFIKYLMYLAITMVWLLPLTTYANSPVNVQVSILPQKYFVERIGKDRVNVDVLVKPGKSPATYSPSPDQIKKLMSSDVYFRIGVPFENGILDKIESIAGLKIVDTREGIVLRQMEDDDAQDHDHDADHHDDTEEHHHHAGNDPHIWMSPVMVKIQAHTIFQALAEIDPDSRDAYKNNYDDFVKNLDDLDNHLKTVLKDLKDGNLFVFHPAFGYFTDAYGLKQIAVETMGKAPKGKALSAIIKLAKKEKTRVIFVQPQFDRNAARKIASAINGAVVSIDPLAYDYLANMENIAQSIAGALKQ